MDTAVMIPAAMGTIYFLILPFLLNVVTVIFSLFIMVGFLSLIKISDYWLLWFCFYRLAEFIKSSIVFLLGQAVPVFFLFRAGRYYFSILLSFAYGLVSFYVKMVTSEIISTEYPASVLVYLQAQSSPPPLWW